MGHFLAAKMTHRATHRMTHQHIDIFWCILVCSKNKNARKSMIYEHFVLF